MFENDMNKATIWLTNVTMAILLTSLLASKLHYTEFCNTTCTVILILIVKHVLLRYEGWLYFKLNPKSCTKNEHS